MTTYMKAASAWQLYALLFLLACGFGACDSQPEESRILVFSKTNSFRHESIEAGIEAIKKLGQEQQVAVDATEDSTAFTADNLKKYKAVVFLNTTGNILGQEEQAAFEQYIQNGGGFVGIHAATDTEYEWPWYGQLSGARFNGHPGNPNVQRGTFRVLNKQHPATEDLPDTWERVDEFYDFKDINTDINVLIDIDETTYQEGTMGDNHPMAWYHEFDGGRAFYTNMGHTDETFSEPLFLKHLWGGLRYAMRADD